MKTLFCPKCGWRLDGDVGMKPECPDCRNNLNLLSGTKEEIDKHIDEKYSKINDRKLLCPFCGGMGFKMITTYEGNSKFNIISSNPQRCSVCSKRRNVSDLKTTGE